MFTKSAPIGFTTILVYVDDLVLVGIDLQKINVVKSLLDGKFSIKDLGTLKYLMEFEIAQIKADISLCQRKYSFRFVTTSWCPCFQALQHPVKPNLNYTKIWVLHFQAPSTYRSLVGKLLYVTHFMTEISFAIGRLSYVFGFPH